MSTPASANGTVHVTDGPTIFDDSGNGWFIDDGQVAEQVTDSSGTQTTVIGADTANVVAIAYVERRCLAIDPGAFHGSVALGFGDVLLEGLQATSGVSRTAFGISVHDNGTAYSEGGTLRPLHT